MFNDRAEGEMRAHDAKMMAEAREKKNAEIFTILEKHAAEIYWEDIEGFSTVETTQNGTWRHGYEEDIVVQHEESGRFFMAHIRNSSKDGMDFEDMNPSVTWIEVVPEQVTVIKYVPKK